MCQLASVASHPTTTHLWEEFGSIVAVSSDQVVVDSHNISPGLLSSKLSERGHLSLFWSYSPAPQPSMPFFWWEAQNWTHHSRCSFVSIHQRGSIPRLDVLAVAWLIQPRLPFLTARAHSCSILHSLASSKNAELPLASRDPPKSVGDFTLVYGGQRCWDWA